MLTLPATRPSRPWHQQRPLRKWVEDLFRLASRKRSYTLLLQAGKDLAWVNPERKLVFITTQLPEVMGAVRGDPRTPDARRATLLMALAAHEAGHVRHSGPKPQEAQLGWLWNALEDERMERLMAREFPELTSCFTLLGDLVAEEQRPSWDGSALEGCLFWRFTHDQRARQWQPRRQDAELWLDVRPLVEAAWSAPDSERVRWIAQVILDLLGKAPKEGGEGGPQPQGGEGEPSQDHGAGGQGEAQPGGQDGAAPPDANQGEQPSQGEGQDQPGGEGEGASSADQPDAEQGQGGEQGGAPAADPSEADQAQPGEPDPLSDVLSRYGELVSASGAGTAQDEDEADGAAFGTLAGSSLPTPPTLTLDHMLGETLAAGIEGHARQLAPLLRPPERPGRTLPDRSRGRYRYDRAARGSERVFDRKVLPSRPAEVSLEVLVDTSSSMQAGERMAAARSGALMLLRAATLAASPVRVWAFDSGHWEVVPAGMPYPEASALLAGLTPGGGTRLAPALGEVLAAPARPGVVRVVAVVCDGDLSLADHHACQELVMDARARGVRFVPLLIGEGVAAAGAWREAFGSALPCPDVTALARTLKAALTALRARG